MQLSNALSRLWSELAEVNIFQLWPHWYRLPKLMAILKINNEVNPWSLSLCFFIATLKLCVSNSCCISYPLSRSAMTTACGLPGVKTSSVIPNMLTQNKFISASNKAEFVQTNYVTLNTWWLSSPLTLGREHSIYTGRFCPNRSVIKGREQTK